MKNIWEDDEPFRDGQQEFDGGKWKEPETYTPVPQNMIAQPRPQQPRSVQQQEFDVEDLIEQVSEDDEDDFTEVLSDARLRLEQGKLYEMVMNHDLFSGVDADPRAAKSVQKQIRKFAKEQMEIMLGMRQEVVPANAVVQSPFSAIETQALKDIAAKLITANGMKEEDYPEETIQAAPVQPPKKKTLNTIGSKSQAKPAPKHQSRPIQKKAEPIQRQPRQQLQPEKPPKELTGKMLHEMDEQEKAEYLRGVNERNAARAQVIPEQRAPWPSYEQQVAIAESQVSRAVGTPSKGNLSSLIMSNLQRAGKI